jgi:adenine-specific DNA methylase
MPAILKEIEKMQEIAIEVEQLSIQDGYQRVLVKNQPEEVEHIESQALFENYKAFTGEAKVLTQFMAIFKRRLLNFARNKHEVYLAVHTCITVLITYALAESFYAFSRESQITKSQLHSIEDIITISMPAVIAGAIGIVTPLFCE